MLCFSFSRVLITDIGMYENMQDDLKFEVLEQYGGNVTGKSLIHIFTFCFTVYELFIDIFMLFCVC